MAPELNGIVGELHSVVHKSSLYLELERWFEEEIAPLYIRHRQLARQSLRRKIGALRETVSAVLRVEINRNTHRSHNRRPDLIAVETRLRHATGYFEETRLHCERLSDEIGAVSDQALAQAATRVAEQWGNNRNPDESSGPLVIAPLTQATTEKAIAIYNSFDILASQIAKCLNSISAIRSLICALPCSLH